jgi:hypothetical protein
MNKSPFPGMDPYLEPSWRDVHHSLCTYARDDLQAQLGEGLVARVDERLVVEFSPEQMRSIYPDVLIVQRRGRWGAGTIEPAAGVALAEPIEVEVGEQITEGFIEIIDARSGGKLITVIEFLSLTNKLPGPGRHSYETKQAELALAQVSLVEINLLRSGYPLPWLPTGNLPPAARTDYQVVVRRGWDPNKLLIYPLPLRNRLSIIAVPLRRGDPVVTLDLQSLIDRVYKNGAYGVDIDYAKPLDPPLTGDDGQWADRLLNDAKLR